MGKNRRLLLVLGLVGLLGLGLMSCSSAPAAAEGTYDRKNRAADFLKLGNQAFVEGQYDQALLFYRTALDLDTAVDHEAGMAVAWNAVASAQTALGRAQDARGSLAEAEALAVLVGDRTLTLQVAVHLVQADLGDGNLAAAEARLAALKPYPGTAEGAGLLHAQANLERARNETTAALATYEQAANLNLSLGLKVEAASNRFMKASVYSHLQRWPEARTELLAALALDRTMENTFGIGQDWRALGTVALRLADPQGAFEAYVRAYRVFEAAGLADQQRKTLELILSVASTPGLEAERTRYRAIADRLGPSPTP